MTAGYGRPTGTQEVAGLAHSLGAQVGGSNCQARESYFGKHFVENAPQGVNRAFSTSDSAALAATNGLQVGQARLQVVKDLDGAVKAFVEILPHSKGSSPAEKVRKTVTSVRSTQAGREYKIRKPSDDDLQFIVKQMKVDDAGNANLSDLGFAFRVWLCFDILQDKVVEAYGRLCTSPEGENIEDLRMLLMELNDGEHVSDAELKFVSDGSPAYAVAYGDAVPRDYRPLTESAAVWFCDIGGARTSHPALAPSARLSAVAPKMCDDAGHAKCGPPGCVIS
eukprot:TRINITY_DN94615_c0_g1_i1.p1 TRINITY_DN94615_c0_g1~~TRINITY_DN94615_c0_g1_i1.p1  ORF type:complete len:280 (-),score=28.85 TRINITY_DN94615_c0_g1_i1:160-999(-)